MEWLTGLLATGLGKFSAGALLGILLLMAKKKLPDLFGSMFGKYLGRLLDATDPDDQELVYALVAWAEKKIPGRGEGLKKYALVADTIVKYLPAMSKHRDTIHDLIEGMVLKMKGELKKRGK